MNPAADIILYNAKVITLDPDCPAAEVVAIKGNKILGVGHKQDLGLFKREETRLIDCEGRAIVPGFNDAHCHPLSFAASLLCVDCSPGVVEDIAGIQQRIRRQAEQIPAGGWIRAANYDEECLAEGRPPNLQELEEAAPLHPVILIHRSEGCCVLNRLALQEAGITRETPVSPAGTIHKDTETGEPNGVISGRNEQLARALPPLKQEELKRGVELANQIYLSVGITSLQDTTWTNGVQHYQYFRWFIDQKILSTRVSMLAGTETWEEFQNVGLSMGSGDTWLRIGGVKLAIDESTGQTRPPQADINRYALRMHKAGFQIAFHVSDAYALKAALLAIEFIQQRAGRTGRRHRLEHCPICPPGFLQRISASQAMVICQPSFLYYGGQKYLRDVPAAQLNWLFPIGSLRRQNIKVVASSDSPMVPCNPLTGIYAMVTRRTEAGQAFCAGESVSALEALEMYTLQGAYASFEEEVKGSISPGKLADLVVLTDSPVQIDPEGIKEIQVMATILDGKMVWENGSSFVQQLRTTKRL